MESGKKVQDPQPWGGGRKLTETPSVVARRKGVPRTPRVPKEYTEGLRELEALRGKRAGGERGLLLVQGLLLKVAESGTLGNRWATVLRAQEVLNLADQKGVALETECFRSLIRIHAYNAWHDRVTLDEMWDLYAEVRESEHAQLDVDMYNYLLEIAAGLCYHNRASLADGQRLFELCEQEGLLPSVVTWAGLIDVVVGLARHRKVTGEQARDIFGRMRSSKVTQKRTLDKWMWEVQDLFRDSGLDPNLNFGGATTWHLFLQEVKFTGLTTPEIARQWRVRKDRMDAFQEQKDKDVLAELNRVMD